jgi:hypothetical protein
MSYLQEIKEYFSVFEEFFKCSFNIVANEVEPAKTLFRETAKIVTTTASGK